MGAWVKDEVYQHLGRIILSTRSYRRISIFLLAAIIVSIGGNYALLVQYAFMPANLANPAVSRFVTSDLFHKNTEDIFSSLDMYNNRTREMSRPNDFYAVDPSNFGIVVNLHYKLAPQETPMGLDTLDKGGVTKKIKFRYSPEIDVDLDYSVLVIFVLIELLIFGLLVFLLLNRKSESELKFEERQIEGFFLGYEAVSSMDTPAHILPQHIENIFSKFYSFYVQLNRRHAKRSGLEIKDEYDVQDVLHALLKLHFNDVRPEECTPSYAGGASRMDFLLHDEEIVIEVKMTRDGLKDAELGSQLLVDIARYASHQKCKRLMCFIFDPLYLIGNPAGLRTDINRHNSGMDVEVFISPNR